MKKEAPLSRHQLDAMNDEYGQMDSTGDTFSFASFQLEAGDVLESVSVRYNTYGELSAAKDNVLVICHALTGNSRVDTWWGGLLGAEKAFDTSKYFVFCAAVLGSCYGTTGPASIRPATGKPYGNAFPQVSLRDSVRLHARVLRERFGIHQVHCVIGGSMGGMQSLEWLLVDPTFVRSAVVIGCGSHHSAWQIGISQAQRAAIYADPKWNNEEVDLKDPPRTGLAVARQIAMLSYRSPQGYAHKFGREMCPASRTAQVQDYLTYQGEKFVQRFDAWTYVQLTLQMDRHDIAQGREEGEGDVRVLQSIHQPVLVMGMDSDALYPLYEQEHLHKHLRNSRLVVVRTIHGHDGFLLEQEQVGAAIQSFLSTMKLAE